MLTATVLDPGTLASMQEEWDALADRDHGATGYQTHAISLGGWRIDAAEMDLEPMVIAVRDSTGTLVGLAPLAIWTQRQYGIPWRVLGGLSDTWSSAWDILAVPDREEEVGALVLECLADHRHRFDQFRVRRVRADARLARLAQAAPAPLTTWRTPSSPVGHWLFVEPGWTGINDRLSKSYRRYVRRCRAKAYEEGGAQLILTGVAPHEAARRLARLHVARWGADKSEFAHPGRVERFGDLLQVVLDRGQGGYLEIQAKNGEPMAALIFLRLRHSAVLYRSAYNPAFADFSPGVVMEADALDTLIRMGVTEVSFGYGNDPYKRHWSNATREVCTVSACAPTARTWGARAALAAFSRTGLTARLHRPWSYAVPGRLMGY